jgi:hypothetical protein
MPKRTNRMVWALTTALAAIVLEWGAGGIAMIQRPRSSKLFFVAALGVGALAAAAVALAQGGVRLILNGKVASTNVRMINGQPYVPLADIARATGQVLVKRGSDYEIIAKGGANQVEGLRGKVGDTLFDGKWRFKVIDVQRGVKSYTMRREGGIDPGAVGGKVEIDAGGKTFRVSAGYEFVIVNARVTNGQKSTQAFGSWYGEHTALADTQGSSYRPIGWDQEGGMFTTKSLLPGAGQDVTAIFLVPEGTPLKDLVVTLTNVSDREPHDVRVTLQ